MIIVVGSSGGSLKDTDAILTVTVPTGSTVTATKSGKTLTPTMWTTAADATQECALFSIPAAQFDATTPWTVTATLGTDSATATVLIDSNKQYDLELSYHYYLYNKGTQFPERGGEFVTNGTPASIFLTDKIRLDKLESGVGVCSKNTLSYAGWSYLVINISAVAGAPQYGVTGCITSVQYSASSGNTKVFKTSATVGELKVPLSTVQSGTYYIYFYAEAPATYDINQIWLE